MGHTVTLGGERLGSGNKNKQYLHSYERSNHDLSYVWRSTMAAGTLIPFMSQLALPGDTFDINLDVDIMTHPTIGPLFGSYKVQLDVFQIPIRLFQAKLHMNMTGIGLDMASVKFPVIQVNAPPIVQGLPLDNQQINPSCILSYLGIRGAGIRSTNAVGKRYFNAIPLLSYWSIYKQYYANKQEERGFVIHKPITNGIGVISELSIWTSGTESKIPATEDDPIPLTIKPGDFCIISFSTYDPGFDPSQVRLTYEYGGENYQVGLDNLFTNWSYDSGAENVIGSLPVETNNYNFLYYTYNPTGLVTNDTAPQLQSFELASIDDLRLKILQADPAERYVITLLENQPLGYVLEYDEVDGDYIFCQKFNQEGLGIKTYQSDLFNNWISTDWIDGDTGINELTKVNITDDAFTINELQLSKKIYDMLMRIAVSGGTYDDWLDAVYTHDRQKSAEEPMYIGGLIKNLVFQEVISNAATSEQPLGTLAGRGRLGSKNKGGHIVAKVDEPSYLMGIISLTPNVDYSQGNSWDMNLQTMDDLHKPGLDQIGFQDLITDQMAWFDTAIDIDGLPTFKSAGKQPAWINYMTNVNKVYGNFADESEQMFMVLNRQYESGYITGVPYIKDLTTYIDPAKFNNIFAYTRRDAQNFWAQIGVNIDARRKMSAKTIPNL